MTPADPVIIEIFDPPMCRPTGLCGPSVDPALLDISEAILKVNAEFDGRATVERYVLSQQPAKYTGQPEILERLRAYGVSVLPITMVNGTVLKERVYPSYADMRTWIEGSPVTAADPTVADEKVAPA
jgi:hypothetical protein